MNARQFNRMIKEIRLVKEDNSIDYDWIATKIWLQMNADKKDLERKEFLGAARDTERKMSIIDAYIDKYGEKERI